MFPKNVDMLYDNNTFHIRYIKDVIDRHEIQFSIVDVKTDSGDNIWRHPLIIQYYPLRDSHKTSLPVFHNEQVDKLKSRIAHRIMDFEQLTL